MNRASLFIGAIVAIVAARSGSAQESRWNSNEQGGFIVSLGRDSRGDIWAGTEDHGVARFSGGQWSSFGPRDGLGDNDAYAITGDRLGRVWVGHRGHGVSVWNGRGWKNYDTTQGPLGERAFALATSPLDGDVWIAHNAGLTRYSLARDSWTHFNRANGFPTDEISALAFDSLGRLYVGTAHQGILIGAPDDDFASWSERAGAQTMPLTPVGAGLPSNRINDLLVTDDDTIYAATDTGLATSDNFGESWTFVRGRDWEEKVREKHLTPAATEFDGQLLREDYVTSLTEDDRALLWIGYRRHGYEVRRPLVNRASFFSPADEGDNFPYASAMLPLGDGSVLLGYYNRGVVVSDKVPPFEPTAAEQKWAKARRGWKLKAAPTTSDAPFPKPADAPDVEELQGLLDLARHRTPTPAQIPVVQLPDDWTTQGNWLGRYGRYWCALSAMISPYDYIWGAGKAPVSYAARLGPDAAPDDGLRYWVHSLYTNDARSLELPNIYLDSRIKKGLVKWDANPDTQQYRRQSEWDDHGEDYPMTKDGPGVYVTLRVPVGDYVLSLYNRNKDGHDGFNRARDYLVSVRPHLKGNGLTDIADFEQQPEWAASRWRDFWGGNWKRFAVRGPQELTVRLDRNYSFNTILAGVFLDEINEEPEPYFEPPTDKTAAEWHAANATPADAVAEQLWAELQRAKSDDVLWWSANGRLFYQSLLRFYQAALPRTAAPQMPALWRRIGTCDYALCRYDEWEAMQAKRGLVTARSIETELTWDGIHNLSGWGRAAVTEALARRKDKALPILAGKTK